MSSPHPRCRRSWYTTISGITEDAFYSRQIRPMCVPTRGCMHSRMLLCAHKCSARTGCADDKQPGVPASQIVCYPWPNAGYCGGRGRPAYLLRNLYHTMSIILSLRPQDCFRKYLGSQPGGGGRIHCLDAVVTSVYLFLVKCNTDLWTPTVYTRSYCDKYHGFVGCAHQLQLTLYGSGTRMGCRQTIALRICLSQ